MHSRGVSDEEQKHSVDEFHGDEAAVAQRVVRAGRGAQGGRSAGIGAVKDRRARASGEKRRRQVFFFFKGEGGKKKDELATILLGFRLFNQALVQSVTKMASLSEQQLQEDLQKFKKMCGQSPNT